MILQVGLINPSYPFIYRGYDLSLVFQIPCEYSKWAKWDGPPSYLEKSHSLFKNGQVIEPNWGMASSRRIAGGEKNTGG